MAMPGKGYVTFRLTGNQARLLASLLRGWISRHENVSNYRKGLETIERKISKGIEATENCARCRVSGSSGETEDTVGTSGDDAN